MLGPAECRQLLEGGRLGRVVVCDGDVPLVRPVNYGVVGGDIVVFTAIGGQLARLADGRRVAFEVDRSDAEQESGWSVIVIGRATIGGIALRQRAEAIGVYPWAAGERHCVVRIRPVEMTGRRISPGRRGQESS